MPSSRRPALSPSSGSSTRHRLVIYLSGVAIGCLLLGWFTMRRSNEAAVREQQRNAAEPQQAAGQEDGPAEPATQEGAGIGAAPGPGPETDSGSPVNAEADGQP